MKLNLKIFEDFYQLNTTSNDRDSKIELIGEDYLVDYIYSIIEGKYGAFGKIITGATLTNLDLINILGKEKILIDYHPPLNLPEPSKEYYQNGIVL